MNIKQRKQFVIIALVILCAFCFGAGRLWGSYLQQKTAEASAEKEIASEEVPAEPAEEEPLNLNTASYNELIALPGIGDVTARKILEFRKEFGSFNELEDLVILKLLTESQLEKIADEVTVFIP